MQSIHCVHCHVGQIQERAGSRQTKHYCMEKMLPYRQTTNQETLFMTRPQSGYYWMLHWGALIRVLGMKLNGQCASGIVKDQFKVLSTLWIFWVVLFESIAISAKKPTEPFPFLQY